MNKILLFVSLLAFVSCGNENRKTTEEEKNIITRKASANFKLLIQYTDTLSTENEIGEIIFRNELPDSIKISSKDVRILTAYVAIFKSLDNPMIVQETMLDTFVAISKGEELNDEIQVEFYINKKNKKGLNYIRGKLLDQVFLNSYTDSTEIRLLEEAFYFNKPVFIK